MFDRVVPGAPIGFRLRATELSNLFYQLDCLAKTTRCSLEAYEDLWAKDPLLGGLDEGDRAAIALFDDSARAMLEKLVQDRTPLPEPPPEVADALRGRTLRLVLPGNPTGDTSGCK